MRWFQVESFVLFPILSPLTCSLAQQRRAQGHKEAISLCPCSCRWDSRGGCSQSPVIVSPTQPLSAMSGLLRLNFPSVTQGSEEPEKQSPVHCRHFYPQQHLHCCVRQLHPDTSGQHAAAPSSQPESCLE